MPVAEEIKCRRYLLWGNVQGIYFQTHTRAEAHKLDLTGHVRNLRDGRVEILACGKPQAVKKLREWLRSGPYASKVAVIRSTPATQPPPPRFMVE